MTTDNDARSATGSTGFNIFCTVLTRLLVVVVIVVSLVDFLVFIFWPVQLIVVLPLALWGSSRRIRWRAEECLLTLMPICAFVMLADGTGRHFPFEAIALDCWQAWVLAVLGLMTLLPRVMMPAPEMRLRWLALGSAVLGTLIAVVIYHQLLL